MRYDDENGRALRMRKTRNIRSSDDPRASIPVMTGVPMFYTITDQSCRRSKCIMSPRLRRFMGSLFVILGPRVLSSVRTLDP